MAKKHENRNLELLVEQFDLAKNRLESTLWELERLGTWFWGNRRRNIPGLAEDIESLKRYPALIEKHIQTIEESRRVTETMRNDVRYCNRIRCELMKKYKKYKQEIHDTEENRLGRGI